MAGLISEKLLLLFFVLYHCVYNRLKMSEYEVYWLTDIPLINSHAHLERIIIFFFEVACTI